MIQINLFTKQKQTYRHRKQTYDYQRGKGRGRDKLAFWDQQTQTAVHKIDKQQGPIAQGTIFNIL